MFIRTLLSRKNIGLFILCICVVALALMPNNPTIKLSELNASTNIYPAAHYGDFIELASSDSELYLIDEMIPLGSLSDFDPLDDAYWQTKTGHDANRIDSEKNFDTNVSIESENYVLENSTIGKNSSNDKAFVFINNISGTIFKNCLINAAVQITSKKGNSDTLIENCTFEKNQGIDPAILGQSITARYNRISSLNDGIALYDISEKENIIEYNWFGAPADTESPAGMNAIHIWKGGNALIRRNKIGGYKNSSIMIKPNATKDIKGSPIENITITENYFKADVLQYYYLFVCEGKRNATEEYQTRPRFITITDNWFESKLKLPIFTGENKNERAIFVRTEEERSEGILRQETNPEILTYRINLGYPESSADARTWIVWNNNKWAEDGSEVSPFDGKGGKEGWYNLSEERSFDLNR